MSRDALNELTEKVPFTLILVPAHSEIQRNWWADDQTRNGSKHTLFLPTSGYTFSEIMGRIKV